MMRGLLMAGATLLMTVACVRRDTETDENMRRPPTTRAPEVYEGLGGGDVGRDAMGGDAARPMMDQPAEEPGAVPAPSPGESGAELRNDTKLEGLEPERDDRRSPTP